MRKKLFVLGNNFFPQLASIYEFRTARQAEVIANIGYYGDLRDYFRIIDFQPEILFVTDESLPVLYSGLELLKIPKIAYLIDTHIHFEWHKDFAKLFDHCFVAQKNYCQLINSEHHNCSWLPLFAHSDMNDGIKRDIDICFVGTLDSKRNPARVRFIDEFRQHIPLTVATGAYREIFNRSRIILNQSVADDINFRVYEAMACGGMLLTDNVGNGIEELFTDTKHFVLYEKGKVEDAVEKAKYYLMHEEERSYIARCGYFDAISKNDANARLVSIVKQFSN